MHNNQYHTVKMEFVPSKDAGIAGDNKHAGCPPRMSDGRLFTDYRRRCDINYINGNSKPLDSYAYRQYLLQNADKIIDGFRRTAYGPAACDTCLDKNSGTMLKEKECDVCNERVCQRAEVDAAGIGLGRSMGGSNVKVQPYSTTGYAML